MNGRAASYLRHYGIDLASEQDLAVDPESMATTIAVNYAGKTWLLAFRSFPDHQSVDIDLFDDTAGVEPAHANTLAGQDTPDALSTPVGVFGFHNGSRVILNGTTLTNHGWPAAVGLVVLADR